MIRSSYDNLPRLGPNKEMIEEWNRQGLEQVDRIVAEVERRVSQGVYPMAAMRAKVECQSVLLTKHGEILEFKAVCKPGSYPADGLDEDNTYAKFTPSAEFKVTVTNPSLAGQFKPGQKFYVDFTSVE